MQLKQLGVDNTRVITIISILLIFILALSSGCNSMSIATTKIDTTGIPTTLPASVITKNDTTMAQETSPTSSVTIDELRNQLLKTGSVFVTNANIASELIDYSVITPSFIPDGFILVEIPGSGGAFNVFKLGLPTQTGGSKYPYSVKFIYSQNGEYSDKVPYFQITQSRNKIGSVGGSSEPVQIGKYEGEKQVLSNNNPPRLILTWNDGETYYSMEGLLINPLDEETLIKIATSMQD